MGWMFTPLHHSYSARSSTKQNCTNMLRNRLSNHVIATCLLVLFTGCYNYRVATRAQAGAEVSKAFTAHSYLWGLLQKPPTIPTPICDSLEVNGLAEVTVKTNFGYSLINVVTLGIWCPIKMQWKCSKPCKKTETL
jgi:hypothetical protein